jgi:hypothetical protein
MYYWLVIYYVTGIVTLMRFLSLIHPMDYIRTLNIISIQIIATPQKWLNRYNQPANDTTNLHAEITHHPTASKRPTPVIQNRGY